ncbi:MAG TPA: hypothetical protein PKC12_03230 [Thiobacillaceae bacterium]|nr:hypothetical protein [Thiobacillaceae bacterium]
MTVLLFVVAFVLAVWGVLLLAFARPLAARWREPVLRHPVLAIESDDWGAGPLAQAEVLARLGAMLQEIRDAGGRPALMTLGLIMEVPDGGRIAATGGTVYHGRPLADPGFDDVRTAIQGGVAAGVFVPQLHGQCHYWPPALLAAAQTDAAVRDWLRAPTPAVTEELPSALQSRWTDASELPSRALDPSAIRQAVADEVATYAATLGEAPTVAVATTFVWNDAVEAAWAAAGVDTVITPGVRATGRDAAGAPGGVDASMLAGERSAAGQTYLVRDVYFEPTLGHAPERLVDGLRNRTRQGRACLVETHRFNFLRAPDASLAALEDALRRALAACPGLRFASPRELAHAMRVRDPEWIETGLGPRLAAWRARLDEIPRFGRAAGMSGLALPLAFLGKRA